MITCKVHLSDGHYLNDATLPAVPRIGEFVWFTDDQGSHRIAYKVENVIYAHHGGEVQLFVKREQTPFFKQFVMVWRGPL